MRNKIKYALAALALVVLAAVSPMKAQAAGGLELYTDYPGISVEAGDSQSISMYVSNDSGSAVEASLSILSMPEGWEDTSAEMAARSAVSMYRTGQKHP